MKFSTAIEFIKNGFFVADAAMEKINSAIGLIKVDGIDDPILIIKDASGMETFSLEPEIIFSENEDWNVALDYENGTFEYIPFDNKKFSNEMENLIRWLELKIGRRLRIETKKSDITKIADIKFASDYEDASDEDTSEFDVAPSCSPEERLKQLQKDFLSKTTQLIYESDITKKIALYTELADITAEIQKLEKEVH